MHAVATVEGRSSATPAGPEVSARRQMLLDEFEKRAAERGLAAVVMADLARDLGVSTKTVYREFGSKAALVQALIDRWAARLEASQRYRIEQVEDPVLRLGAGIGEIFAHVSRYAPVFWRELRADYPEQQASFDAVVTRARLRAAEWISPALREDLDRRFALDLLGALVRLAVDPERSERFGLTREQALDQAVTIWASGALGEARPSRRSRGRS